MAILTKFLQLLKPEKNDYVDVEKHLSENYDKIDAKLEELSNSNDEKLNKGNVSSEYDTAKKIEDKIKTKLNQGNVPDVLNSAEKIIKALQGNTGIKFDESLLYLNDSGTKKKGYCYIDKLTDGIFECIQETTTTVNNATYFKNFSNKENSDRLSNLTKHEQINGSFEGLPDNISTSNNPLLMETHIIGNIGFSRVLFQDLSISLTGANKRIIKFHREINIKASTVESIVIDKDNFIEIVIKSDGIYIINSKGNGIFSTIPIYCNCIFLLN